MYMSVIDLTTASQSRCVETKLPHEAMSTVKETIQLINLFKRFHLAAPDPWVKPNINL